MPKQPHSKFKPRNVKAARQLRQRMTPAEKLLWKRLRNKQLGAKVRCQHPISDTPYVVDFCCIDANIVIEIDGAVHRDQVEEDADRQKKLLMRDMSF